MGEYVYQKYPTWVRGVIAQDAAHEAAVLDGSAIITEIKSAQGSTYEVRLPTAAEYAVFLTAKAEAEAKAATERKGK